MGIVEKYSSRIRFATVVMAAMALSACALVPAEKPVTVEQADQDVAVPVPAPPLPPTPAPPSEPVVATPAPLPLVAVVLSNRHPAYDKVAAALADELDNYTVFDLSDKSQSPDAVFHAIADANTRAVVAIGLQAALSATSLSTVPVVFCQVFNIQEHNLVTENSRGVSALPPLDLQIAAWKKIDPRLKSIGAIVGSGHQDLIAEAKQATADKGIDLQIKTAQSDRETLYLFNRLAGEIDGYWLFPDNRVLSATTLKEIMKYAARHRVQVSVFNESLLKMGAAISSTTDESNIAETVIDVLDKIVVSGIENVPPVSPLSEVHVVTNESLLRKLTDDGSTGIGQPTVAKIE